MAGYENTQNRMKGRLIINELKKSVSKRSCPNLKHYHSICLEGIKENRKNFSHNSRSPSGDLNPAPAEY